MTSPQKPKECSLIVTTYNRPDALECVLLSILRQKIMPNEVIIADDGSTEETRKIIEQYAAFFRYRYCIAGKMIAVLEPQ